MSFISQEWIPYPIPPPDKSYEQRQGQTEFIIYTGTHRCIDIGYWCDEMECWCSYSLGKNIDWYPAHGENEIITHWMPIILPEHPDENNFKGTMLPPAIAHEKWIVNLNFMRENELS